MNESGKKIDWVLLLSLVVIVSGIVFLVFMGFKFGLVDNFLNNSAKQNGISALEAKYCGYAKKTLDWMDKKRLDNVNYPFYVGCNKDSKECVSVVGNDRNGGELSILLARYKYFLKTQDQEQLLIVKKDIDVYFKQSELVPIKNIFWDCRILTEMRDENVLGSEYVRKIDKICQTSQYLDTEFGW